MLCVQIVDNHGSLVSGLFFNSLILKSMFIYSHKSVKKYIFFGTFLRLEKTAFFVCGVFERFYCIRFRVLSDAVEEVGEP